MQSVVLESGSSTVPLIGASASTATGEAAGAYEAVKKNSHRMAWLVGGSILLAVFGIAALALILVFPPSAAAIPVIGAYLIPGIAIPVGTVLFTALAALPLVAGLAGLVTSAVLRIKASVPVSAAPSLIEEENEDPTAAAAGTAAPAATTPLVYPAATTPLVYPAVTTLVDPAAGLGAQPQQQQQQLDLLGYLPPVVSGTNSLLGEVAQRGGDAAVVVRTTTPSLQNDGNDGSGDEGDSLAPRSPAPQLPATNATTTTAAAAAAAAVATTQAATQAANATLATVDAVDPTAATTTSANN